jgi:hypothetical protein
MTEGRLSWRPPNLVFADLSAKAICGFLKVCNVNPPRGRQLMKMIAEYVEHAHRFEQLAVLENNPELKATLEKQAAAYRKLATERAKKLGIEPPKKVE